jgi:hypothetical protein
MKFLPRYVTSITYILSGQGLGVGLGHSAKRAGAPKDPGLPSGLRPAFGS